MPRPAASRLQKAFRRLQDLFRKPQEQRYVEAVLRKIGTGQKHSTLGPDVRDEAYTREKAENWARHLIEVGLKPDHLCVEYGCGSLWAAEPVIRFLAPGRFIGLDVTDQFYAFGRERLGDLLREKQVRLDVISDAKLEEIAALQPDFIFSRKVLPHIPEAVLPRYLANVASLMAPHTIAMLDNTPMFGPDGEITGRRHTVAAMQALLPTGFTVEQQRHGAVMRRRA